MAKFVLCVHVVIWSVLDYPVIGPRPMSRYMYKTTAWLAQLVERQSAVRKVEGSSPRPHQHSGS